MLTDQDSLLVTLDENAEKTTIRYDGRRYGLLPGVAVHVPFEAVRLHFGDPRSGESPITAVSADGRSKIQIASRAQELQRLNTLWGVAAETLARNQEAQRTGKPSRPVELAKRVPKVTVTDVEGNPVRTVIDDPGGEAAEPIEVPADDSAAMSNRISTMQRQLDVLLKQQAAKQAAETGDAGGDGEPTEDTPNRRSA